MPRKLLPRIKDLNEINDGGGVVLRGADKDNPAIHRIRKLIPPRDPITDAGDRFKKFIRLY